MCYDTWKTTHPDEYEDDSYEESIRAQEEAKDKDIQDWIKEILHHVYVTGDIKLFEGGLEELCGIFEIKIPTSRPKFQKKRSELFNFAAQLTKDYATTINQ